MPKPFPVCTSCGKSTRSHARPDLCPTCHAATLTFAAKFGSPEPAPLAQALEAARDHIFEAFDMLSERTDVPEDVVVSIQTAYRAVRQLEVATLTTTEETATNA